MVTAILLPILATAAAVAPPQEAPAVATPQVQVRLSSDEFVRGDNARVYVTAGTDGYLLVLHAEPDGRIHVLFPVDPGDDNYVRGGKTYEVRGRGDRDAFTVYGPRGTGTVYAAFSQDPFQFAGFTLNGHWDYRAQGFAVGDDPEAALTALAQQMAGTEQFSYDLSRYDVVQQVASGSSYDGSGSYYPYYGYYGGWYQPWHSGLYFGISFGSPWYTCWACNGYYYDPWFYGGYDWDDVYYPYYRPYYYGYYGSYGHRPYYVNRYAYYGYGYGRGWRSGYWRSPVDGQRYGFYYVQPGRRTLTLYGSGPTWVASNRRPVGGGAIGGRVAASATAGSGRRMVMPPATDGGRVIAGPRRAGDQMGTQPRVVQPHPLEASPRATPRRDPTPVSDGVIRRVPSPAVDGRSARSPSGLIPLRQSDPRAMPRRDESGARAPRGLSPVDGRGRDAQPYVRPRLERRQVERPGGGYPREYYAPSRPQRGASPDYVPRSPARSEPPQMSRPSAPRFSEPARSSGPSRPSAPSRSGGRVSSGGRRRGG